jgi:hypothetical protein
MILNETSVEVGDLPSRYADADYTKRQKCSPNNLEGPMSSGTGKLTIGTGGLLHPKTKGGLLKNKTEGCLPTSMGGLLKISDSRSVHQPSDL